MARLFLAPDASPQGLSAILGSLIAPNVSLSENFGRISGRDVLGRSVVVTIAGEGFSANGAGLLAGTATVRAVSVEVNGQSYFSADQFVLTGPDLTRWLMGDGDAFNRAITAGNDEFSLSNFSDLQDGGVGNDTMRGGSGNDTLLGGPGADLLLGENGSDTLNGDADDDNILGGNDGDLISGGTGRDRLNGDQGNDTIRGDDGDDTLAGGPGDDSGFGGAGADRFEVAALRRASTVDTAATIVVRSADGRDEFSEVEVIGFIDGALHLTDGTAAGQIARLYEAALGRTSDQIGLSFWVQQLESGAATLRDVASGFVNSVEFSTRFPAVDNAGFVTLLYANTLGRTPDAVGFSFWTGQLQLGAARQELLVAFSESSEFRLRTADPDGIFVADLDAIAVVRLYQAALDRQPDAAGLSFWTEALERGVSLAEVAAVFTGSAEFTARFGADTNQQFVTRLYDFALGRTADPDGLDVWLGRLDSGAQSRGSIVLDFALSGELGVRIAPQLEDGVLFA